MHWADPRPGDPAHPDDFLQDGHIVRSPNGHLYYAMWIRKTFSVHFADGRQWVSWMLIDGAKYYVRDDGVVWLQDLPHPPMKPTWRRIYDFKVYKRKVRTCRSCSNQAITGKIVHERHCPRA